MNGMYPDGQGIPEGATINSIFGDGREKGLGFHIVTPSLEDTMDLEDGFLELDVDHFKVWRWMNGILEHEEVVGSLPQKNSFDFTGSIDLKKGCFLG